MHRHLLMIQRYLKRLTYPASVQGRCINICLLGTAHMKGDRQGTRHKDRWRQLHVTACMQSGAAPEPPRLERSRLCLTSTMPASLCRPQYTPGVLSG